MTWHSEARPATFRGVPFHVNSPERGGGRRVVTHEYPQRDLPFGEDMGRKARTFSVDGYVLGAEYIKAKNALLDALEAPGVGTLFLPFDVQRTVMVGSFRVRESADKGGIAEFSIDFLETPAQAAQPASIPDAPARVEAAADVAMESIGAEFLAAYSPGTLLDSVGDALRAATLTVSNVLLTVQMEEQALALITKRINDLEENVSALVEDPDEMLSGLTDIIEALESVAGLVTLYAFEPGVRPPGTTPNRIEEQTNFDATQLLIQRLAAIQAARLASVADFDSYEAAVEARNQIADLLDEQAEAATDDTYPALLQLRADLVKVVPGDAGELPHLVTYTAPNTVPSLVLAHRLYGNVDLESDLLARNAIRNPGFVVGGRELEILSD